jgi:hypothetical protein
MNTGLLYAITLVPAFNPGKRSCHRLSPLRTSTAGWISAQNPTREPGTIERSIDALQNVIFILARCNSLAIEELRRFRRQTLEFPDSSAR